MHNERDQEVHYINGFILMAVILMVFLKKVSFGASGPFWFEMACHYNSGSTLKDFLEIMHDEKGQEA